MEKGKDKRNMGLSIPDSLRRLGQPKRFQKNEMLFSAQDEADGFYYVERGEIRVYKMDEQGREAEIVRLGPGGFLGEAIVFASPVFPVFAQAVTDAVVRFFARKEIKQEIAKNPSVAMYFVELLAGKCVVLSNKIESLGLQTVRQRLARYILSGCSGDQSCVVELKVKKGELAKILGTVSETLSRNLKQMQEEGLIEVKGNKISVLDCPALRSELLS